MGKPLFKKRCSVIREFLQLGFGGIQSFYNCCKTIDTTLNGFAILQFYTGDKVTEKMVADVENVLNVLKNE